MSQVRAIGTGTSNSSSSTQVTNVNIIPFSALASATINNPEKCYLIIKTFVLITWSWWKQFCPPPTTGGGGTGGFGETPMPSEPITGDLGPYSYLGTMTHGQIARDTQDPNMFIMALDPNDPTFVQYRNSFLENNIYQDMNSGAYAVWSEPIPGVSTPGGGFTPGGGGGWWIGGGGTIFSANTTNMQQVPCPKP